MHSSNWWRFDRNARNKCSTSAGQDGPVKTRWEILWKSKSGTLTTIQSSGPLTIWNQYDVWVFIFHIFPVGKAPIDLSFVLFWWNRQKTWGLWIPNHVWLTKQKVNPRPRIKAIKEYCSQREGLMKWLSCTYIPLYNQPHFTFFPKSWNPLRLMFFVRNDKYEGKPIYWIEEEIELEWQKTSSRSHAESAEYQVSGNIADSMADSMEGLRPDVQSIAGGKLDGAGILKSQLLTTKNHKSSDNSLINPKGWK